MRLSISDQKQPRISITIDAMMEHYLMLLDVTRA